MNMAMQPGDRAARPFFGKNSGFKLGLFSPNCSGGMAVTKVDERWDASWDSNLRLAQMADAAGIDFLLPIARWIGYGGQTDFQEGVLETITWAAGLLASTTRINVFATAHTGFIHPLVGAKQFTTIDQIGHGRFGLNVVCGWNKPEYDMFGIDLPPAHTDRYAFGQEWYDIVRRVWSDKAAFDVDGAYFHLHGVRAEPKPWGGTQPAVMNAGSSPQGRDWAARNADVLFTVLVDLDSGRKSVTEIKQHAQAAYGRTLDVFTTCYVVCRPTRPDAEAYHHYYADEQADWPAVDRLMELQGLHAQSFPPEALRDFRIRFAGGHGVYPLIGSPDDVAAGLAQVAEAGFGGTTLSFVNYEQELPYFVQEVLPRLEKRGVRIAV